jgi:ribosomal protein S18 acetylase RimI-like enzyme
LTHDEPPDAPVIDGKAVGCAANGARGGEGGRDSDKREATMARPARPGKVTVRDARPDEAALVADLIHELARMENVDSDVTAQQVGAYRRRNDSGILVAALDERLVGALTWFVRPGLFHGGRWGCIDELIVTAPARGKGIGDALVAEVLRRFVAAGCREATVSTELDNERAAALYRKHGLVDESLQLERHF